MSRKQILRYALVKATPILCSYLFVSMAYGILMAEAGFPWFDMNYNAINPNRKERLSMTNRTMNRILTGRMYMLACHSLMLPY